MEDLDQLVRLGLLVLLGLQEERGTLDFPDRLVQWDPLVLQGVVDQQVNLDSMDQ